MKNPVEDLKGLKFSSVDFFRKINFVVESPEVTASVDKTKDNLGNEEVERLVLAPFQIIGLIVRLLAAGAQ